MLQANKRVSDGMFLAKKKQYPIAVSTISKGENYFEDALSSAKEAQSRGVSGNDVVQKLVLASKKYQEILLTLKKDAPKDQQDEFQSLLDRMKVYEKDAAVLAKKNQQAEKNQ